MRGPRYERSPGIKSPQVSKKLNVFPLHQEANGHDLKKQYMLTSLAAGNKFISLKRPLMDFRLRSLDDKIENIRSIEVLAAVDLPLYSQMNLLGVLHGSK